MFEKNKTINDSDIINFNKSKHINKSYLEVVSEIQSDTTYFNVQIHKISTPQKYNNDKSIPFWLKLVNYILINYKYANDFYYSNEYLTAKINRTEEEFEIYSTVSKAIKRTCKELKLNKTSLIEKIENNVPITSDRCYSDIKLIFDRYKEYKTIMNLISSEIPNTKRSVRKLVDMNLIIRAQFTNENFAGSRRKVFINKKTAKFMFNDFSVHNTTKKIKKRYSGYLKSNAMHLALSYFHKLNIDVDVKELKHIETLEIETKKDYLNKLKITDELYINFYKLVELEENKLIRSIRKVKRFRIVSILNNKLEEELKEAKTLYEQKKNQFIKAEINNYLNYQHHQSRELKHILYYYQEKSLQ